MILNIYLSNLSIFSQLVVIIQLLVSPLTLILDVLYFTSTDFLYPFFSRADLHLSYLLLISSIFLTTNNIPLLNILFFGTSPCISFVTSFVRKNKYKFKEEFSCSPIITLLFYVTVIHTSNQVLGHSLISFINILYF